MAACALAHAVQFNNTRVYWFIDLIRRHNEKAAKQSGNVISSVAGTFVGDGREGAGASLSPAAIYFLRLSRGYYADDEYFFRCKADTG